MILPAVKKQQSNHGRSRCREFREPIDEADIIGFLGRFLMMMPITRSQLRHHDADDKEADCGLDVGSMRDGQTPKRAGQEDVKPQRGRDCGDEARRPVTEYRHRGDRGNQDQGCDKGKR